MYLYAIVGAIPIILTNVFMVGLDWPAKKVMPIAWLVSGILGLTVWKMPIQWISGATIYGGSLRGTK